MTLPRAPLCPWLGRSRLSKDFCISFMPLTANTSSALQPLLWITQYWGRMGSPRRCRQPQAAASQLFVQHKWKRDITKGLRMHKAGSHVLPSPLWAARHEPCEGLRRTQPRATHTPLPSPAPRDVSSAWMGLNPGSPCTALGAPTGEGGQSLLYCWSRIQV